MGILKTIFTSENLLYYGEKVQKEKKNFKEGFDGMSLKGAISWLRINGEQVCKDLINGYYRPMPAIGFKIAKQKGEYRNLARLTAMDNIIQSTILDTISMKGEEIFSKNSFGYRKGRGVEDALKRYIYLSEKYKYVGKIDFNNCYDNIDHTVLETNLKLLFDNELADMVMKFAKTPLIIDEEVIYPTKGII